MGGRTISNIGLSVSNARIKDKWESSSSVPSTDKVQFEGVSEEDSKGRHTDYIGKVKCGRCLV